jgi:hypothetical protein
MTDHPIAVAQLLGLKSLTAMIRTHEGLEVLRDTHTGSIHIETAYVIQILDRLCDAIEGKIPWSEAYARIDAMAP